MKNDTPPFSAIVEAGRISLGTALNRERVRLWCKYNEGARLQIHAVLPESGKLRRFFEGAVVPLIAYYSENMNHRNHQDLLTIRDWLKIEFNGELVEIGGRTQKIGKSTKGRDALNPFVSRVIEWIEENYAPPKEALDPVRYKTWKDTVWPIPGTPDNYIDYLVSLNILK